MAQEPKSVAFRLQSSSTTHPRARSPAVESIASSFIPPNPFEVSPNEEERSALDAHARPGLEKRDMVQSMSSGRPAALGSIMSTLEQRRDQMFPKLRPEEIDRLRRFGEMRRYAPGELLFVTGEPSPGMFVLIAGNGCRQRPGRFGTCGPNRRRRTGRVPRRSRTIGGPPRAR